MFLKSFSHISKYYDPLLSMTTITLWQQEQSCLILEEIAKQKYERGGNEQIFIGAPCECNL